MKLKFACLLFLTLVAHSGHAAPVAYTFTGTLSGRVAANDLRIPSSILDVPFQVSISADTDTAAYLFPVAGAGSLYANNGTAAWQVNGIGTAYADSAQIYALPGIGTVGFSWGGVLYPFEPSRPLVTDTFNFTGTEIGTDNHYGQLGSVVGPIDVFFRTSLRDPQAQPEYTRTLSFNGVVQVTLMEIKNVTYSVTPVPVPAAVWLLGSGLALFGWTRKRLSYRVAYQDSTAPIGA